MVEIVLADKKDIPSIQEVANSTWFDTYMPILPDGQCEYMFEMMYSSSALRKQMDDGHVFFLCKYNGAARGYVSIRPDGENLFHLEKLYVQPDCQGLGLGRLLIEKAFGYARDNSSSSPCYVELNVNRNNKSLQFYQHVGMIKDREGDFDIGNGYYMNDYIMRKQVK